MPRITPDLRTLPVHVELSHPSGTGGRRAELRIIDARSGIQILEVAINPLQFYNLMTGMIDGAELPARIVSPRIFGRVGKQRHHWSRKIGYGIPQDQAEAWAAELRDTFQLDTSDVRSVQGGLSATWELWSDALSEEDHAIITNALGIAELPERAR